MITKIRIFLTLLFFAIVTLAGWGYLNRPTKEPDWPAQVAGFCYSPFNRDQTPEEDTHRIPREQIRSDLAQLSKYTREVRTYGTEGSLGLIPGVARELGMKVTLGIHLTGEPALDGPEIRRGIELAREYPGTITRLIVGNEVLLTRKMGKPQLFAVLDQVRSQVTQPVSTADGYGIWFENPDLAAHTSFVCAHILPYWAGKLGSKSAVDDALGVARELQRIFPDKPLVVGEIGWPSQGQVRGNARPGTVRQAEFLRLFLARVRPLAATGDTLVQAPDAPPAVAGAPVPEATFDYFLLEAYDQPWKRRIEGNAGCYWGVFDADRDPKFPFTGEVRPMAGWWFLASVTIGFGTLILLLFFAHTVTLKSAGRGLLTATVYALCTTLCWLFYSWNGQYMTASVAMVGAFLFLCMLGVSALLVIEAHEWVEANWYKRRLRALVPDDGDGPWPRVSIHVPAYNEPPEMLCETLDALAELDYPDFEVLVIDNNTRDEAVWRPVEAHCAKLNEAHGGKFRGMFRFFHVAPLAGFKAGALNFALRATDPRAEVIGVIDSDYCVTRDWLRLLVPGFKDPKVAIMQAPQDYRDADENAFKSACFAEYRGFFYIGMVTRNERNAIIQHGTMTLVRRSTLERVGGWDEGCITEDAELGLRVFEAGEEAIYTPRSCGRGLMPDSFTDFKKQRSRWAFGSMQILRTHLRQFFLPGPLTLGQRYHFLAGWLPWIADGASLVFSAVAVLWSLLVIMQPLLQRHVAGWLYFEPPPIGFSILPIALFAFKNLKLVHLYRNRVGATPVQTLMAAVAGLSLSYTIGVAMISGAFTKDRPFFRTPKRANRHVLLHALLGVTEETLLFLALAGSAVALLCVAQHNTNMIELTQGRVAKAPAVLMGPDIVVWSLMLLVQGLPFLASILMALLNALQLPSRWIGVAGGDAPGFVTRAAERGVAAPGA